MKKLILLLLLSFSLASFGQVKQDANGNYYQEAKSRTKSQATATGKTFTDSKGKIYPVFQSSGGALFVIKTSKAGNEYKYYLKPSHHLKKS